MSRAGKDFEILCFVFISVILNKFVCISSQFIDQFLLWIIDDFSFV